MSELLSWSVGALTKSKTDPYVNIFYNLQQNLLLTRNDLDKIGSINGHCNFASGNLNPWIYIHNG